MDFKTLRRRQKLSIRQAAEKLNVGYQSICRYENKGRVPRNDVLVKMLDVYKCSEHELGQAVLKNVKGDECIERGNNESN